ncbi:hypothetical protein VPHG_00142 [Vibrio phage 11895-B1]|uniref:hypothetical protein n=1 Tax=Vibrio phage 11895-B1 TaxID=754075 RepID=UPI0002C0FFD7|nr:hypothetical protein VPHG_00142 [Vibrio phage 11895-B1]AGH32207.1 hypothetical protein VPHG_00142 [Vibrio phage 11895-B1]
MIFYHGTTSLAPIEDKLLPPDQHDFGINEQGRTKHAQKVFFTTVKGYAEKYARTACKRAGGTPVVYEVLPKNPKLMTQAVGCNVYYDSEALIYEKVKYNTFDNIVSYKEKG